MASCQEQFSPCGQSLLTWMRLEFDWQLNLSQIWLQYSNHSKSTPHLFIKRLTHVFSITYESLRLTVILHWCQFALSFSCSLSLSLSHHLLSLAWHLTCLHMSQCYIVTDLLPVPSFFRPPPPPPLQAGTMAVWVGSRLRLSCNAAGKPASWWETANQELASTPSRWSECTDVWTWFPLSVYVPCRAATTHAIQCRMRVFISHAV